ncbi:hypothetical protein SDC9_25186 [bioreactor metagenome]|uniref:Uncharacterized protein n=1 Tax=bioreactor metagenome TaxID=1076179 RepID=A0A644UK68_9ZZZZ
MYEGKRRMDYRERISSLIGADARQVKQEYDDIVERLQQKSGVGNIR